MTGEPATLAILQIRPRKGRPEQNINLLEAAFAQLAAAPPGLIVLPEAALTAYFLEGATYECARTRSAFATLLTQAWQRQSSAPVEIVAGFFEQAEGTLYNSALSVSVAGNGSVINHVHRKVFLPTYGVFDEARFLSRGRTVGTYRGYAGRTGIAICEDLWHGLVPTILALKGIEMLLVPSASPGRGAGGSDIDSVAHWHNLLRLTAAEHGVFVVYAGLVGFEGGKALSGGSALINPFGTMLGALGTLEPGILRAEIDLQESALARAALPLLGDLREVAPDLLRDPELQARLAADAPHG